MFLINQDQIENLLGREKVYKHTNKIENKTYTADRVIFEFIIKIKYTEYIFM